MNEIVLKPTVNKTVEPKLGCFYQDPETKDVYIVGNQQRGMVAINLKDGCSFDCDNTENPVGGLVFLGKNARITIDFPSKLV